MCKEGDEPTVIAYGNNVNNSHIQSYQEVSFRVQLLEQRYLILKLNSCHQSIRILKCRRRLYKGKESVKSR